MAPYSQVYGQHKLGLMGGGAGERKLSWKQVRGGSGKSQGDEWRMNKIKIHCMHTQNSQIEKL